MNGNIRKAILAVSALAVVGSLGAFFVTGTYWYTRFRDAELESANAETGLSDLFADAGTEEQPPTAVESVNAIGFLPSGPGLASASVVTISGPALAAIGVVWWLGRHKKQSDKTGSAGTDAATA